MPKSLSFFPITRRWPPSHPGRLQLYSLNTPNGVKVSIMLEETGLPYEPHLVDFGKDGRAKVTAVREGKESTAEGSYAVEGNKLTVTLKQGEKEVKHAITIKKLTDTEFVSENEKGKTAQFKRKR